MSDAPVFAARDLVKVFGRSLRALDGVDLAVRHGEVFGLLGANGAGKTTLVKLFLGLARPTAGTVRLRGLDPQCRHARRRVGYLPEGHRFPDYLSGQATLRLFGRLAGVDRATLDRRIGELLELVGLGDRGGDRVGKYSKGMTQRLGLAAALIDDPDVLFLDEPTDGVDPVGRRHIRDVLLAARDRGTTIFINSHLLSEVERTCDRITILHRGRVVREGRVEDLTRPTLRYHVRFAEPVDPAVIPRVDGVSLAAINGHLELTVDDLAALNRWIDEARARRHVIADVAQQRSDLEEVFIDVVTGEQGHEAPTATSRSEPGPRSPDPVPPASDPGPRSPDPGKGGEL